MEEVRQRCMLERQPVLQTFMLEDSLGNVHGGGEARRPPSLPGQKLAE